MKKFIKSIAICAFAMTSLTGYGQTVLMGDVGYPEATPADCSTFGVGANNFFDDGNGANYSANFNNPAPQRITLNMSKGCPKFVFFSGQNGPCF